MNVYLVVQYSVKLTVMEPAIMLLLPSIKTDRPSNKTKHGTEMKTKTPSKLFSTIIFPAVETFTYG